MRLLLVEDDPMIGSALERGLRRDGHSVDWVQDGAAAESAARGAEFDAILLDLGLPRQSGLVVLEHLRKAKNATPVIIITARDAVDERVQGLDLGADDYLVKPFDFDELAARIRAVTRRRFGAAQPELSFEGLRVNTATHEVVNGDEPVAVSAREYAVLEALIERPRAVVSRRKLEERLYAWDKSIASNAVEVHIHNLRRKLGSDRIRTVRGIGYTLARST
jgi:DNA-binding response OmpR family regulator